MPTSLSIETLLLAAVLIAAISFGAGFVAARLLASKPETQPAPSSVAPSTLEAASAEFSGLLFAKMESAEALTSRLGGECVGRFSAQLVDVFERFANPECVVALGEHEWGIGLPQRADAQAIQNAVRKSRFLTESGTEVLVTARFGFAPADGSPLADLLKRARAAARRAARQGRNRLEIWTDAVRSEGSADL